MSRQVAQRRARSEKWPPVGRLLSQIDRQVARMIETGPLAGRGLTIDQWRAVDILADGEGHPMSEIATTIVIPGATLTKIMDKLVDAALVYRLVDDRDRRRVLAVLSEKGHKLHSEIEPEIAACESEVLARLGDRGPVLVDLLAQLAQSQDRPRS